MLRPPHLRTLSLLALLTATACKSSSEVEDHPSVHGGDAGGDGSADTGATTAVTDAAMDGVLVSTDDGGPGTDVPLGDDSGPLPPRKDGGADRKMGGTGEERYAEFRAARDSLLLQRLGECFNGDLAVQAPAVVTASDADLSLRFGLTSFDDQAAEACLQAIRAESCQALAAEAHGPACEQVLHGELAVGNYCRIDEDCKEPSKNFCKVGLATICNTRCLPRTLDGEKCASGSECLPGSSCRPGPDGLTTICAARVADGGDCDSDECKAGSYCRASSPDGPDGMCSAIKEGGPCAGSWQCPPFYSCVLAAGGTTGACTAGRKAGEPCQVQLPDMAAISDCGFGLGCYPDATSGQLRCSAGRKTNEACTDRIPCRDGQCVAGKCAPLGTPGQSCSDDFACEEELACVAGKCAADVLPGGGRCGGNERRSCPTGTFCKPDNDAGPDAAGACVPDRKVNEACEPGQCEPMLDCVGGTCRRCS